MKLYKTHFENTDHNVCAIWSTSMKDAQAAKRHLEEDHSEDKYGDMPIRIDQVEVPTTSQALCLFLDEHASSWNEGELMRLPGRPKS